MQNKENNQLLFMMLIFVGILGFVIDFMSNALFGGFQGIFKGIIQFISFLYFCVLIYISYQLYNEHKEIKYLLTIIVSVAIVLFGIYRIFLI